ncbi:hypothetical protein HU200_005421 [Digitaria exilis]|uniref:Purple acid phosphatase N-terminal domain-containing protein n=1 Tax=Digitaria exilis TaxID=1010633 RepID=A0A835KSY5_9POAL|nr:hypothetical protein HU200_005421 [Digitaria exilis]
MEISRPCWPAMLDHIEQCLKRVGPGTADVHPKRRDAVESSNTAPPLPACTPTPEACATAQTARRITPFPFLDAMESNQSAQFHLHAHAAPLYLPIWSMHTLSDRRLRCAASLLVSTVFAATATGAAAEYVRPPARAYHPHGAHGARRPSSAGTYIMFTVNAGCRGSPTNKHAQSRVEYGKASRNYTASATGEHTSYRYFLYTSGKIHHVKIGPLEPSTVYYYRCGMARKEFTLRTPPATLPIELAVVGDLGRPSGRPSTLVHVSKTDYDMLLVPGDLSYADTQQPLATRAEAMDGHAGQPRGRGFAAATGAGSPPPFAAYGARWPAPHEESGSASNLYYSFDAAGAAVHVGDAGLVRPPFDASSDQYRWLARDLAAVDRARHAVASWRCSTRRGGGEAMRVAMERLLFEARVDVVSPATSMPTTLCESLLPCLTRPSVDRSPTSSSIMEDSLAVSFPARVYNNEANPEASFGTAAEGGERDHGALGVAPQRRRGIRQPGRNGACWHQGDPAAVDSWNDEL